MRVFLIYVRATESNLRNYLIFSFSPLFADADFIQSLILSSQPRFRSLTRTKKSASSKEENTSATRRPLSAASSSSGAGLQIQEKAPTNYKPEILPSGVHARPKNPFSGRIPEANVFRLSLPPLEDHHILLHSVSDKDLERRRRKDNDQRRRSDFLFPKQLEQQRHQRSLSCAETDIFLKGEEEETQEIWPRSNLIPKAKAGGEVTCDTYHF